MHPILRYGLLVIILLLTPVRVHAARAISISVSPDQLTGDEPLTITASPSGFTEGETVHVKGAFFVPGSTNYFGFSRVGDASWIKNIETALTQPKVTMGLWNNYLSVKSDTSDSGYQGEGEYSLKLGFYYVTGSGGLSSVQWSTNTVTVVLREPPSSPTVTPSTTPSCTPRPTPTATLSPTNTPVPTVTFSPLPVAIRQKTGITATRTSAILGISNQPPPEEATQTEVRVPSTEQNASRNIVFAFLAIGVGLGLLASAVALQQSMVWKNKPKKSD